MLLMPRGNIQPYSSTVKTTQCNHLGRSNFYTVPTDMLSCELA